MRRRKPFALLALFVVGSMLTLALAAYNSQPTYAVTAAQKQTCLDNFGGEAQALTEAAANNTGKKTEKGNIWDTNNCGEKKGDKQFCTSEVIRKSIPVVVPNAPTIDYMQTMSKSCDRSWEIGQTDDSDPASDEEDTSTSCAPEGIGWLLCPLGRAIAEFIGLMYKLLSFFLAVPMISTDQTADNTLYQAWTQMRNIANALLVIVFILIIYSQMMGGRK